jgi:hypothetical protein
VPCGAPTTLIPFKFPPHDLDHSHATLLLANNVDAVAVASRLGHSDAATTLREYAHALRKRDEASAQVMQQLFDVRQSNAPDMERLTTLHPKVTANMPEQPPKK